MPTILFVSVLTVLTLGSVMVGVLRNRRFRHRQELHEVFAEAHSMQVAYMNHRQFTFFGSYRGYNLRIEPVSPQPLDAAGSKDWTYFTIPVVNPNLRWFRILKSSPELPDMDQWSVNPKATAVQHDLGDWLGIRTNDPMFSHLILSQDVKISIFKAFRRLPAAVLYIEDEELVFVCPLLLTHEAGPAIFHDIVELMADIKDELN
ncbi:MAG: hypothetical protein OHK0039_06280 [Bacteroidia bacterium]